MTRAAAALLVLPSLAACYEYVPLAGTTPKTGEVVTFEISDQGRVGLNERFGSGVAAIEGRVQSTSPDLYLVDVFRVTQINGESAMWSGESVRLQRAYIGSAKGREFSRTRTTIAAVGAGVITTVLIAGTMKLTGHFDTPPDEPTPPKPVSARKPIRIGIVLRP